MITRELKIIVADDHALVREGLIKVMEKKSACNGNKRCIGRKRSVGASKNFRL